MTLDPEGNLWFSNVTRHDTSDGSTYFCYAESLTMYVSLNIYIKISHRYMSNLS